MIELRFFQFNVGLIPLILTMITVFFQVFTLFQIWWYDEEINFYHFIYDNLFYFPFFLLLLIATCFNVVIINEKGVTRIAYLMPFLRKSFKWKKIKHPAKVLEFYNQRGIKNTKKSLWLIDCKDICGPLLINFSRVRELPPLSKVSIDYQIPNNLVTDRVKNHEVLLGSHLLSFTTQ